MTPEQRQAHLMGQMQDILAEPALTIESTLGALWDSMAIVQVQAVLDDVGVTVTGQQLADCTTVRDVVALGWPA